MEHPDLVPAAGALRDQARPCSAAPDGRIIFALGIGGAKFPRDALVETAVNRQRDNECDGPRKVGAAVHRQTHPLMMMSMAAKERFKGGDSKVLGEFSRPRRTLR